MTVIVSALLIVNGLKYKMVTLPIGSTTYIATVYVGKRNETKKDIVVDLELARHEER